MIYKDDHHFYFSEDQEATVDATIVCVNNVTVFRVIGFRRDLQEGEIIIKSIVKYQHNHTTKYTMVFPKWFEHTGYTIIFKVQEIDVQQRQSFFLTRKRGVSILVTIYRIYIYIKRLKGCCKNSVVIFSSNFCQEMSTIFLSFCYSEFSMAVNPMKIVVVRGDRSNPPYFICAVSAYPRNFRIVWSKEIGALKAKQNPVSHML